MASVTDVVGYYPCDTHGDIGTLGAHCVECYRTGFEPDDRDAPILRGDESDTPTHCAHCGELIPHALTDDGRRYVAEAMSAEEGDPDVLESWRAEYGAGLWTVSMASAGCVPDSPPVWFATRAEAVEYAREECADILDGVDPEDAYAVRGARRACAVARVAAETDGWRAFHIPLTGLYSVSIEEV